VPRGKTDLLLRFFDSQFFDEWIALTCVATLSVLMLARRMRLLPKPVCGAFLACMTGP
jgi:hypothetical protein